LYNREPPTQEENAGLGETKRVSNMYLETSDNHTGLGPKKY